MILTGLKVAKKVAFQSGLSAHGSDDSEPETKESYEVEDEKKTEHLGRSGPADQETRLFGQEQTQHLVKLMAQDNIYDYVLSLEQIKPAQRAKIMQLTRKGVYSNLQFYLVSSLSENLKEQVMEDIIVLYYKFQANLDDQFTVRAKSYIE